MDADAHTSTQTSFVCDRAFELKRNSPHCTGCETDTHVRGFEVPVWMVRELPFVLLSQNSVAAKRK